MAKYDRGKALNVRGVSDLLLRQLHLEAEAEGVTMRAWVLETLCKACGVSPEDERAPMMGRPSKAKREEAQRLKAEQQAAIEAWEQRTTCEQAGMDQAGDVFICKLPRDHAGECHPTPATLSLPSLAGVRTPDADAKS